MASSSNSIGSLKRCAPSSEVDGAPKFQLKRLRLDALLNPGRPSGVEDEQNKKIFAILDNSQLAETLLEAISKNASLQEVVLHVAEAANFRHLKSDPDLDEDFGSGVGEVQCYISRRGSIQSASTTIANITQLVEGVVKNVFISPVPGDKLKALEIVVRIARITVSEHQSFMRPEFQKQGLLNCLVDAIFEIQKGLTFEDMDWQILAGSIRVDIQRVQSLAEASDMMDAYILCDAVDLFTHPSRPLHFHGTVVYLFEGITDLLRFATATSVRGTIISHERAEIVPKVRRLLHTVISRGVLAKIGRRTCIGTRVKAMGVLACVGDVLVLIYKLEQQIWDMYMVAPCPLEEMLMDAMQRVIGYSLPWEKEDDMDAFCQDEVLVKILLRLDENRGEYLADLRSVVEELGLREPDDETMGLIRETFDEKLELIERGFDESLSIVETIGEKMEMIEEPVKVKLEPIETVIEIKVEDSDSDQGTIK